MQLSILFNLLKMRDPFASFRLKISASVHPNLSKITFSFLFQSEHFQKKVRLGNHSV